VTSLHAAEPVTERGLSPIADNILMLRYMNETSRLEPTLNVVKTRGSRHDRGTYCISIDSGGMRIGSMVQAAGVPQARQQPRGARRSRKNG
jgi:circadian clock protein KaiC